MRDYCILIECVPWCSPRRLPVLCAINICSMSEKDVKSTKPFEWTLPGKYEVKVQ